MTCMSAFMGTLFDDHHAKDGERILLLFFIISICCFITLYSGLVLKITTVYTHLYYIPILLASVWWRRKGIPVVFFLSLLLLLLYKFFPGTVVKIDYIRIFVFSV